MKRILVISNNCFSKTNSNGRTLGNLFYLYEKDKIAQFYLSGEPDYSFCENYYQVSDNDVLNSVFPFRKKINIADNANDSMPKRTVKNMILRNLIWNVGFWKKKEYKKWLDSFNPEVVLLQIGDCSFMIKHALWCAERFKAKLYIYNTEGYYFKDYNYFRDGHDILYSFFISNYKKWFRRVIGKAECSIYLCDKLKEDYDKEFHKYSVVIYNSSSLKLSPLSPDGFPVFSYIGNLELDRDKSLCEIANVLQEFSEELKINVYGKASEQTKRLFAENKGINYCGFIDYDDVQAVMTESSVILHVEGFNDFYIEDTKYGFSGKIADSLCSGRALLIYAPERISCMEYLKKNQVAFTASDISELKKALSNLMVYENVIKMADKQLELGRVNHNLTTNSKKFVELFEDKKESFINR